MDAVSKAVIGNWYLVLGTFLSPEGTANYGQHDSERTDWCIGTEQMARTNTAHFMHCLPVRRNVVVRDAVLDAPQSLVLEQAKNRIFSAQAVLLRLLGYP